ncbi:MAG: hypothetical protein KC549_00750 [Myxococcales bacterium]|nr:hypothetical protein [Myxococcales bacterium]MCB9548127.1 hypothetical protein [Myxococcales bacterium]
MTDDPRPLVAGLRVDASVFGPTRGARCDLRVCRAACCRQGIWVDVAHIAAVRARAADIAPHLPPERRDPAGWFDEAEVMVHADFPSGRGHPTEVLIDPAEPALDTCVFRRPDYLCALQITDPALKPYDCYTYPLLKSEGELTLDRHSAQELGGADCQQPRQPAGRVVDVFRDELKLMLSEADLAALLALAGRAAER